METAARLPATNPDGFRRLAKLPGSDPGEPAIMVITVTICYEDLVPHGSQFRLRRSWFSGLIVGVRTERSFCRVGDSVRAIKIGDGSCGSPDHSIAGDSHARGLAAAGRASCALLASPGTGQAVTWRMGLTSARRRRHRPGRGRPCPSGGSGVAS
jgi:hypothetical protein